MLNLDWKTSPRSQIFSIPSNFWNHRWDTEIGAFSCPSCYFVKIDRTTVLVPINLRINNWSLYHLKKCRVNNKIYTSQLSTTLFFYNLLFKVKKIDVRLDKTLKLNFILMFFDIVYSTSLLDTVTRYTIYSPIFLVEGLSKWSSVLFCYFLLWLEKSESRIICILLFEIEFRSSSFLQILVFFLFFRHQDSNSYYLVVAAAKIPKFWNVSPSTSIFRYANLKIVRLSNQNLSIYYPTFFLNFVIAPYYLLV